MRLHHLAEKLDIACREEREEDAYRLMGEIEAIGQAACEALQEICDLRDGGRAAKVSAI